MARPSGRYETRKHPKLFLYCEPRTFGTEFLRHAKKALAARADQFRVLVSFGTLGRAGCGSDVSFPASASSIPLDIIPFSLWNRRVPGDGSFEFSIDRCARLLSGEPVFAALRGWCRFDSVNLRDIDCAEFIALGGALDGTLTVHNQSKAGGKSYNLWRQVLECFDPSLLGLTATPSKQVRLLPAKPGERAQLVRINVTVYLSPRHWNARRGSVPPVDIRLASLVA